MRRPESQIASVVDHAYVAIRERILDGALARGARVHQEVLAAELGVSRTPVREALRRLAAEGLVEMHTNRGARVADVSEGDMRASYEARLIIEPGAARLAAQRGSSEPQARMRAAVAAQRRAIGKIRANFEANRDFHVALVAASGNEFLRHFVENLWVARIGEAVYERQAETPEQMRADADEHEQPGGDRPRRRARRRDAHPASHRRRHQARLAAGGRLVSARTGLRSVPTPTT